MNTHESQEPESNEQRVITPEDIARRFSFGAVYGVGLIEVDSQYPEFGLDAIAQKNNWE